MNVGPTELLVLLVLLLGILLAMRMSARSKKAAPPAGSAPSTPVTAELQSRIRALTVADRRIEAIKLLRAETRLGLLNAKNAVDAIAAGNVLPTPSFGSPQSWAVSPGLSPADLADRARFLAGTGREAEAIRLVATETGMSAPEATTFVRALLP